jgi:hypothetical protein
MAPEALYGGVTPAVTGKCGCPLNDPVDVVVHLLKGSRVVAAFRPPDEIAKTLARNSIFGFSRL